MRIILIAGLWLTSDVWNETATELARLGHDAVAVRLPGVDHGDRSTTLDDQVDAFVAAIDDGAGAVVVVGHSAACTLAWIAADRRPEQVAHVPIGPFQAAFWEAGEMHETRTDTGMTTITLEGTDLQPFAPEPAS